MGSSVTGSRLYAGVVTLTLLYLGSRITDSTVERCCLVAIDVYTALPYAGSYTRTHVKDRSFRMTVESAATSNK
ncbi:hypothetical protein EV421DRAFT_1854889 [Armillaria borealis]|uniref:Uncharacterized protein n=1 Tax=Armillaria borealis TaxID=47425 RepID=A0AA39IWN8_9AGAR|nr:hypothetical protein EV421DRAFT_1854889 [Armillaria borealis]